MTFEKAKNLRNNRKNRDSRLAKTLLESMEPRLLLAAATGNVEVLNRTTVSGWAYDPDTRTSSINVQVRVDGAVNTVTANLVRNDLATFPPVLSPNHGFSFNLPALGPGAHTIQVFAVDSTNGSLKLLKSATLTNPAPFGNVDVMNAGTVSGWVADSDAGASAVQVRVDNNGAVGTPVAASNARPDLAVVPGIVGTNHGFSISGSFGVVDVWALDNPTNTPVLLATNSTKPIGSLDILTTGRVAGWAHTPDVSGNMTIRVFVDGALFQSSVTGVSRPDVASKAGGRTDRGFDFALNGLTPGAHIVQVYAINSSTTSNNSWVLLGTKTLVNKPPIGALDIANGNGVAGWVADPDTAASINYRIKVDGATVTTATASNPRPDLAAVPVVLGTAHGFNSALSSLSAGPHKIELFALDAASGTEVLIQTTFINNTKPFGWLDIGNQVVTKGWAFDPDSPTTPVNVIVVLDGVRDVATPADDTRNDLLNVLPNADHSFEIQTPTHLAGTHVLQVIAIDTFTGEEVLIGQKVFTNKAPRGAVQLFAATGVVGWAQDPDRPFDSILVLVRIDGQITTTVANRPTTAALTKQIGSPNHGFALAYTKLSKGAHFIEVFGVDPVTGVSTLLGSKRLVVA